MAQSSILGGVRAPTQASGRDTDTLGPSDTSDSGADIQGEGRLTTEPDEGPLGGATPSVLGTDSDSGGTGERASAVPDGSRVGADIGADRIDGPTDAQDLADVSIDDLDAEGIDELATDDDTAGGDADEEDEDA
ncbi:hypothetical protein [Piscinibacter koreensis]|uniref:Chemotaxis protein n=1 Tax=Piscinibacter koreensis TaxID=2742824 RepID=A0A7Y6NLS4_9BURK|nr:hypothetical protein [Schlegelella koreensis]NUZ05528.1 hypothetical protein [Schlegelella koreensis]